MEISYLDSVAV